jgi:hypothetical protein
MAYRTLVERHPPTVPMNVIFKPDDDQRMWIGVGVNMLVFGCLRNRLRGSNGQSLHLPHSIALSITHYATRSRFLVFASKEPLDMRTRFRRSKHLIVQCPDERLARCVFDKMFFGPSPYTTMYCFVALLNRIAEDYAYTVRDRVSLSRNTCFMYFFKGTQSDSEGGAELDVNRVG